MWKIFVERDRLARVDREEKRRVEQEIIDIRQAETLRKKAAEEKQRREIDDLKKKKEADKQVEAEAIELKRQQQRIRLSAVEEDAIDMLNTAAGRDFWEK